MHGGGYNRRKKRCGGYRQGQYSATAVETGEHLWRCLMYVDLNMVRAGMVAHPREWQHAGYHEIVRPRQRYRIIDRRAVCMALEIARTEDLSFTYEPAIAEALAQGSSRDDRWTRSVAVGRREYVERVAADLGGRAVHRKIRHTGEGQVVLREPTAANM